MLKFISNLFRKNEVAPVPLAVHGNSHFTGEAPPIVPTVEIAHLSLAAILAKFPADLRGCVQTLPDAAVTVTLPLPTILKQLPTCSVKMSLASLYRQAPAGIFKPGPPEEKRMVEVPLPEIFKRVRPELLKRRQDQRPCPVPEEGYNLFGDKDNPHAVALTLPETPEPRQPARPAPVVDFGTEDTFSRVALHPEEAPTPVVAAAPLAPPADMAASLAPAPALKMAAPAPVEKPVSAKAAKPVPAEPAAPKPEGPPLVLPIRELADKWPELIQAEVGAMNGSTVTLPNGEVTSGLAKGRVVFKWGQLREWITPPPPGASGADTDTELALPLRIIAPAFLKLSKGGGEARKRADVGEEIPALFHGADAPVPTSTPAPVTAAPEPVAVAEPALVEIPAKPAPAAALVAPAPGTLPQTLSELFGQPEKASWSPGEIVENVTKLPGVGGAVVAMQEGLLVAHRLPDHMNGEAFAAFLPQVFARLNQYAGEMKLGEVNALTIHSEGLPCQMFRHGEVLFAALGKEGEALPSAALTLCASHFKK